MVIAGNRPSFRVLVVRDETKDLDQTLDLLGQLLPDTVDRRRTIIRDVNAAPRFSPVPVKSDLTWEEFAKVNLYANELPGVMADMNDARLVTDVRGMLGFTGTVEVDGVRHPLSVMGSGMGVPSMSPNSWQSIASSSCTTVITPTCSRIPARRPTRRCISPC